MHGSAVSIDTTAFADDLSLISAHDRGNAEGGVCGASVDASPLKEQKRGGGGGGGGGGAARARACVRACAPPPPPSTPPPPPPPP
jgi:hypothetical protein